VILARDGVVGLSQLDLQSLHLVFVPALLLVALFLDCRPIVLQGIAGMLVFVFQRLNVRFVLSQPSGHAGDPLLQLLDEQRAITKPLLGLFMGSLFVLQGDIGTLQLRAERRGFLAVLFHGGSQRLAFRREAFLRRGDPDLGLLVQAFGQPAD